MRKLLFLVILLGLSFAPLAKAEEVYGFLDGKFYNSDSILKYFCFLDGKCYDLEMKLAPISFTPVAFNVPVSQPITPVPVVPVVPAVSVPIAAPILTPVIPSVTPVNLTRPSEYFIYSNLGTNYAPGYPVFQMRFVRPTVSAILEITAIETTYYVGPDNHPEIVSEPQTNRKYFLDLENRFLLSDILRNPIKVLTYRATIHLYEQTPEGLLRGEKLEGFTY